jgi:molybdopterin converting factor small subunit
MMQAQAITIRLPQALSEHANGQRELTLPTDSDLELVEVLAWLNGTAPAVGRRVQDETGAIRRFVNVYVGESECRTLDGLNTRVSPGTVVSVIGSVAGG